ncbi:MAG: hypothetical protein OEU84_09320 [Xanthomonadales bacterium]|nr:hypothetical protein [Xanthomonadales bacterium]MDH4019789.1 hypothetical protein [Xanthomonadales bacterium]
MNDRRLHRLYRHFQELPLSMRTLFTGTLLVIGMGYMFGLIYVYAQDAGRDGKPGLSVDDIIISYSGSSEGTKLEAALQGPMSSMLPVGDAATVVRWIRSGADKEGYESTVKPIVVQNCLDCHDGSNPHLSNLDGFENVQLVVAQDTGASLHTLVRVSHIHLFGMTFIFFIMGFIFSHAFIRPVWLKSLVVLLPFLCIAADVSSWYFTKLYSGFAWVVMIAGGVMAMSFAFMWFTSMYQMWFYTPPKFVNATDGHLPDTEE